MSEQDSQATGVNEQAQSQTAAKVYEESEVNSRVAAARREAEAKLKEATERLNALEAKEKEREEKELSEMQKLQKQIEDRDKQLQEMAGFKDKWTQHEQTLVDKIEKEKEGLTDAQRELVDALPLTKRMDLINQYKEVSQKTSPPKGFIPGGGHIMTIEDLQKLALINPEKFKVEYEKYKQAKQ